MNINEAIEQLKYYQNKPYVPTVRKVCDIALETIEALQQENEQLRAQVAKMSGRADCTIAQLKVQNKVLLEQLANIHGLQSNVTVSIPADYHNPADVEALRKVREALRKARETISARDSWFECDRCANMCDALATINKAIGGKEDE